MSSIKKILKKVIPIRLQRFYSYIKNSLLISRWKKEGRPVPPPGLYKQYVVTRYQTKYNCSTLVETGTYQGAMVYSQIPNFKRIYSIELNKDFWIVQNERFKKNPTVSILHGDSGKVLHDIVPNLDDAAIFWLDAHYSGGLTAKGGKECPIYEELDAIFISQHNHILLIDDARCFNGTSDYPTIKELSDYILSKRPQSKIEVKDDIIRIVPNR